MENGRLPHRAATVYKRNTVQRGASQGGFRREALHAFSRCFSGFASMTLHFQSGAGYGNMVLDGGANRRTEGEKQ